MMILGSSAVLKQDDQFVFEIQKSSKWIRHRDGQLSIGMGCIGGGIEGSETPLEALKREVSEEIGCEVDLKSGSIPFSVIPGIEVVKFEAPDLSDGCHFVWEGDEPGFIPGGKVAVYVGCPVGDIRPDDLPAVILVDSSLFFEIGKERLTIEEVIDRGGRLIEKESIPRSAHLFPVGTAELLFKLGSVNPKIVAELLG